MHELSLCRSIVDIIERARDGRQVQVVHLRIGRLRQVVPDTLVYCWGLVTDDSALAGSRLQIESVPVRLRCQDCAASTEVEHDLVLVCGACSSGAISVEAGEEFLVTSMDLAAATHSHTHPPRDPTDEGT
ncbi:MAG: hydrogenase maturation nickel metallochaperone HypA [Actinomycetia bacterium]|nr:hydrogenase maturation nickel metallochaperone HypA [Actinomycetes bacterium]